ncbi:unnamed protein product, partial [Brugia timori]|uniref:G_PROTEIN_RECEP_F1_2 domain-containing protein n=1 Tax=Brugia timori TaxID=42155 RepID=A0A0R3RCA5_9BILA
MLHFSFLLTLNRFVVLILPKYCSGCIWRFLFLLQNIPCRKLEVENKLIRRLWSLSIPNIMFVMYIAIFYSIRLERRLKLNKNQRRRITQAKHERNGIKLRRYEWSMLIQAAWNCGILEIEIILFNYLSPIMVEIFGIEADIPSTIFINCFIIFSCALLPTIHFIYCKQSHNIIKHHLYGWLRLRIG